MLVIFRISPIFSWTIHSRPNEFWYTQSKYKYDGYNVHDFSCDSVTKLKTIQSVIKLLIKRLRVIKFWTNVILEY